VPESRPANLLEVGRFGRPHGVRGQITVNLSSNRVERVRPGARLWAGEWFTVSASREQSGRWVVDVEGVTDRTAAERLVNRTIWAEPIDDPEAVWIHQVIGAAVRGVDGTEHGRCVAVLANPADDLLELHDGVLIPARFVERVDEVDGTIVVVVDPPAGLFEVYRSDDVDGSSAGDTR
jgi:16S rRNA processing protein RimM